MPIDFHTAAYSRQYREEHGDFRRLSILTKAIAAYLRNLVDPIHGHLRLHNDTIPVAFAKQANGSLTQSDRRFLGRCVAELLTEGYLVRCRFEDDAEPLTFITREQREIPLSLWLEDKAGDWVVIGNWVPAQNGLTRDDTQAWHTARGEFFASSGSKQPTLVRSDHDSPGQGTLPAGVAGARR